MDFFDVRFGSSFHNSSSDQRRSGERDFGDIVRSSDGFSSFLSVSGDTVVNSWWESGLFEIFTDSDHGEWGNFGWFVDNGVTSSESWSEFPFTHKEWEVPW